MKSRLVTRGKFNCRGSGKFNVCSSHLLYSGLTVRPPRNRQLNLPPPLPASAENDIHTFRIDKAVD